MVNDLLLLHQSLTVFMIWLMTCFLLAPSIDSLHDMVNDLLLLVPSIDSLHDMVNDLLLLAHQALTVFMIWLMTCSY